MDCGDVVRVFAVVKGIQKEIAKGILMGLAGSKHARKVIPKGWRSIKLTAYKGTAGNELCPIPTGWAEVLKEMTVEQAEGRTILWPDNLVRSLLPKFDSG